MKKEKIDYYIQVIFEVKNRIRLRRDALLREFNEEFPPAKNSKGYLLTGTQCGSKNCEECPHSLVWRWYERGERKVVWGKTRHSKLPPSFWNSRRKEKVKERFRYYQKQMDDLNRSWKVVQEATKRLNLIALTAAKKLIKIESDLLNLN